MALQKISIGTTPNDGTGDDLRSGGSKINSNVDELNTWTGWAQYTDTQYTAGSPFSVTANTDTIVPNNAGNTLDSQKPSDITTFYDGTVITGRNGDGLLLTIDFIVVPTNANTTFIEVWLDITGGTGTPLNLANLYRTSFSFPKGTGVSRAVNLTAAAYTLNTWQTNGAVVKVRANGACDIYEARYITHRTHKAKKTILP